MNLDIQQLAQQQAQQQAAMNQLLLQVSGQLYAALVAQQTVVDANILRSCAANAKAAAPYLMEAFGFLKVDTNKESQIDV